MPPPPLRGAAIKHAWRLNGWCGAMPAHPSYNKKTQSLCEKIRFCIKLIYIVVKARFVLTAGARIASAPIVLVGMAQTNAQSFLTFGRLVHYSCLHFCLMFWFDLFDFLRHYFLLFQVLSLSDLELSLNNFLVLEPLAWSLFMIAMNPICIKIAVINAFYYRWQHWMKNFPFLSKY